METIFTIIGGGQKIRHNVQYGRPVCFEEVENSDWPEAARCNGQNFYSNTMWSTDLETLQRWANEWAGKKIELTRCD